MGGLSNDGTIWNDFIENKLLEEAQQLSEANKTNSHKNLYPHKTGSCGYVRKYDKWEEMEQQVTYSGATPAMTYWIERAKHYLYVRGVTLSADGNLVFKSDRE